MTNHPITPPPELVWHWFDDTDGSLDEFAQAFATQAARWGADQELEACCEWAQGYAECGDSLRAARRPKPPTLKEQALDAWDRLRNEAWCEEIDFDLDFIRRALEQLDD